MAFKITDLFPTENNQNQVDPNKPINQQMSGIPGLTGQPVDNVPPNIDQENTIPPSMQEIINTIHAYQEEMKKQQTQKNIENEPGMDQIKSILSSLTSQLDSEKKRSEQLNSLLNSVQQERSPDQIAFMSLTQQLKSQQNLIEKLVHMIIEFKIEGQSENISLDKILSLLNPVINK